MGILPNSVFLVVLCCSYGLAQPLLNHPEWIKFKSEHGKVYNNENEESMRNAIFNINLKIVEEHNKLFEQGLKTFTLRINKFGDLTPLEFKYLLKGLSQDSPASLVLADSLPTTNLPNSFDWRPKGAVTDVKNQGQCASCWAFSATGAMEGQLFIKKGQLVSLSEQNLIDCSTSQGNHGCNGGWPDWGYNYVSIAGIDTEDSYPYDGVDQYCRFRRDGALLSGIKSVRLERKEEALKAAVAHIGPISICIDASNQSFMFYGSGLYYEENCSSDNLDHAVLAVGYGSDGGMDYWQVKNSWGTSWGESGYIRMSRNRNNNCGVVTRATYPAL